MIQSDEVSFKVDDNMDRLQEFCDRYNLDAEHLAEVLSDPKVIPRNLLL
jgi:branched-subunit amino acid aminotransferase/4-amino-4-deoxychorismate lyase